METDVTFEPWSSKRTTILGSYTTSERIPITTVTTFCCDCTVTTVPHIRTYITILTHTYRVFCQMKKEQNVSFEYSIIVFRMVPCL